MNQAGIVLTTDVLVVGGGMAGCFAALKARGAGAETLQIDKGYVGSSGQSPFADSFCIFNEAWGDNLEDWVDAVAQGGDYVNHRDWTRTVFQGTYAIYEEMKSFGIPYLTDENGELVRVGNDVGPLCTAFLTDKRKSCEILRREVLKSGATIMDRIMITDLIQVDGKVCGAVGMSVSEGDFYIIHAKAVILATGAASLKYTGWPNSGLTADGDMMAYRAGASLIGKEFNDVHTTELERPNYVGPAFLNKAISGPPPAVYKNCHGEIFSTPTLFHMAPEFEAHRGNAPIWWLRKKADQVGGPPPGLVTAGATAGMSTHKSEGIWPVGLEGGTELPGLYAAGDALGIMLCGAAYSAPGAAISGSGVVGALAGKAAATYAAGISVPVVEETVIAPLRKRLYAPAQRKGGFSPDWVIQLLNNLMVPYYVLFIKEEARLKAALELLTFYRKHLVPKMWAEDAHQLRLALECSNLVMNCEMKLRASMMRKESRGTHYREDYPTRDNDWFAWILIQDKDGEMALTKKDIPEEWKPDLTKPSEELYLFEFPVYAEEGEE